MWKGLSTSVVLEKTPLGLNKIEYHLPDMGINPSTPLRSWLGRFYLMLGTSFWERRGGIGRELGDVEKLSVRKEGNGSWWFSPKKGWEAQSSQTQKLYLGRGKIWGWESMAQEEMGLNWGEREGK